MANDIKVPGFVNYTDCRPNTEDLSEIEKQKLNDFVNALSKTEQIYLVKCIKDWHILQNEVTRRHDNEDCKNSGALRALNSDVF